MNTFSARKIGEVLAFALVGNETITQGQTALEEAFGHEIIEKYIAINKRHIEVINVIDRDEEIIATIKAKAEATSQKLRSMRDSYIQEKWDDIAELLEWLGFFEGAAIVHWSLVSGVSKGEEHNTLSQLASEATDFHKEALDKVCDKINEIGSKRKE